jgi:hypothetical protein
VGATPALFQARLSSTGGHGVGVVLTSILRAYGLPLTSLRCANNL